MPRKKAKHPRRSRSYKATDMVYNKAMRMAKKNNTDLANVVERMVKDYGENGPLTQNNSNDKKIQDYRHRP